jgi:hypothetical protein
MSSKKSYTYLVGWSKHNKFYYGVRWANVLPPEDDLWNKYFTSSGIVHRFREQHGEPDIVQVRKTFDDHKKAIDWEIGVLTRVDPKNNQDVWLNRQIGGCVIHTPEIVEKMRAWRIGKKLSEEHKRKIGISVKLKQTPDVLKRKADKQAQEYTFVSPEGKKITFKNLRKFCRDNNLIYSCMVRVASGERKYHHGWSL